LAICLCDERLSRWFAVRGCDSRTHHRAGQEHLGGRHGWLCSAKSRCVLQSLQRMQRQKHNECPKIHAHTHPSHPTPFVFIAGPTRLKAVGVRRLCDGLNTDQAITAKLFFVHFLFDGVECMIAIPTVWPKYWREIGGNAVVGGRIWTEQEAVQMQTVDANGGGA
jgi:hypothetical protein